MNRLLLAALALLPSFLQGANPPPPPADARAREIIASLHLSYLDGESGYFGLIGRSSQHVIKDGRELAAQSQIYYLLTAETPTNYLHWLDSDDTHILLEGGPVDYFIFHPDGRAEKITLGRDFAAGERLVIAVPGGCWKALRLRPGAKYALMANVLSPEWTADRVKVGARAEFFSRYAGAAAWATEEFLHSLAAQR
ncbi:MAG TPA: cupin domain-containing protein [Candidatus Didemnitutus sp.]|nr:cupin domain-containing protein [Candidatus Didemnitutus sp.]